MKPVTAILFLSLAAAGTACSDSVGSKPAGADAATETASAEPEVKGKLNLNIGKTSDEPTGMIVTSGSAAGNNGMIISPSGGGNFQDVEGLDVEIVDSTDALLDAPPAEQSDEDDIIRLPE